MLAHLLLIDFAFLLNAAPHFSEGVLFLLYVLCAQPVKLKLLLLFQPLVVLLPLRALNLILLDLPSQVLELPLQLVIVVLLGTHFIQVDFRISDLLNYVFLSVFLQRASSTFNCLSLPVSCLIQHLLCLALPRDNHVEFLLLLALLSLSLE